MFTRPIHIGLSPNTSREDYFAAGKILVQPWKWKQGEAISQVEKWFADYFGASEVISFNAGRSALLAILESLNLGAGNEVMLQAFTCVAVPNSVIWSHLKPIFIDIDESLNIDVYDAEKKISAKTKVLIVQHTFGTPADMDKIVAFCKKHNLILIEDLAHSLGATYKNKLVGTFGDAAFFSFGRDKIISSVFGGTAIKNQKSKIKNQKLIEYQANLSYPSYFWILQQLLHPLISLVALYTYDFFSLGKAILFIAQKLGLLSFPVYVQEKLGKRPIDFPKKYPNALAELLIVQLKKLETANNRRREIAATYFKELKPQISLPKKTSGTVYLRFNLQVPNSDVIRFVAKKQKMILGSWYTNVIDPKGVNLEDISYQWEDCPKAEKCARESVNLPTYPTLSDMQVKQISKLINSSYESTSY